MHPTLEALAVGLLLVSIMVLGGAWDFPVLEMPR